MTERQKPDVQICTGGCPGAFGADEAQIKEAVMHLEGRGKVVQELGCLSLCTRRTEV